MLYKTSKSMRSDPLFMRNQYPECGQWGIPLVKKQKLDISNIRLIACSDTRSNDNATNKQCGVHFFADDYSEQSIAKGKSKVLHYHIYGKEFSQNAKTSFGRTTKVLHKNSKIYKQYKHFFKGVQ